jgi:protein-tyrosine phosphatase
MSIMTGLVDIHAHLLPGIDDGPTDLADSIQMARAAVDAGIETMAVTPHLRSDFPEVHVEELAQRCESLREELAWAEVPLTIVAAAEVSLIWALEADEDALRLATYGQRGTDVLIETPSDVSGLERLLGGVQARGLRVTLGHPERSYTLQGDPGRIAGLRDQGILMQVNAEAVFGRRRTPAHSLAKRLCREGLADVIASDGHRASSWRPVTAMSAGVAAAEQLVGEPRAHWMASVAPAAIVAGEEIPEPPPIQLAKRRWWRPR